MDENSSQYEHYFAEQNISVCYINGPDTLPAYNIDFEKMGYVLTQKLLEYKHSKIACLMKEKAGAPKWYLRDSRNVYLTIRFPIMTK
ncbi:MAG: hypothetical protein ACLRMZ_05980 [Blautia marasmi]